MKERKWGWVSPFLPLLFSLSALLGRINIARLAEVRHGDVSIVVVVV